VSISGRHREVASASAKYEIAMNSYGRINRRYSDDHFCWYIFYFGCRICKNAVEQWLVYQAHTLVSPEGPSIETRRRYLFLSFCFLALLIYSTEISPWIILVQRPKLSLSHLHPPFTSTMNGSIIISDLQIHLANGLGPSAFGLAKPPPCPLSLTVEMILEEGVISADEDTMLGLGVNYSSVSKAIYALLSDPSRTFTSSKEVAEAAAAIPLALSAVQRVDIKMELSRAVLHARSAIYTASIDRTGVTFDRMMIKRMQVACIIGLHPHEKAERQRLEVDIELGRWDERIGLKRITDMIFTVRRHA
jgi:dihydroneopterin aldolase